MTAPPSSVIIGATVDTPGGGHIHPKRGGRGRFERSADTAARDAQATELRGRGCSYQAIAEALGMSDRSAARKAVERALAATVAEPAEELRRLQLAQLDKLSRNAWRVLDTPHPLVSAGKVMTFDGVPLRDPQPLLAAIDRLLRIAERRARLLGLDAPIRVGPVGIAELDAQILELEAELAGRAAAPPPD